MQRQVSHQVSGAVLSSLIDWVLNTRVILKLNMAFGQELVVLLTTLSVFGMFLAHAWR